MSLGPLVIHLVSHTPRLVESPCPAGQNTVYVRLIPGSGLRIVADPPAGTSIRVTVPAIRVTELRRTAGTVEIKHDLERFVAGQTMMNTYDLKSGRYVWLLVPTHLVPESSEIARVCGHDSTDADAKSQGVFYAASVYRVAAP